MHDSSERPDTRRRTGLACPLCRKALAAGPGPDVIAFECAGAHVFSPQGLLQEHSRRAARVYRDLETMLEAKIAISNELAERAHHEGRHHLALYLEIEIEDARRTMAVVGPCLHDEVH